MDRISELPDSRVYIHRHGFGRRPRNTGIFAVFFFPGTLVTYAAAVHKQHKGPLKSGDKYLPFQF